jgi:ribosomal protein L11 methylase PrmA
VCGVDIDPIAVHAAAGNAALNDLRPTFLVGDATAPECALPAADTVVANIALAPILRLARRFAPGADGAAPALQAAHLLLAGLLVEQGEQAAAAFPGYEPASRRDDGTWLMLHLTRRA